jgi:sugar phosphate permease
LAPLLIVPVVAYWGWRAAFYSMSIPGLIMAFVFWKVIKDRAPTIDDDNAPSDQNRAKDVASKIRFIEVLRQQNMLGFVVTYFFFDIAYWGLTSWLPTYLVTARGLSMVQMGVAAALPQIAGFAGSISGGWLSDRFFRDNRRVPIIAAQLASAVCLYMTFTTMSASLVVLYQVIAGFCLNFFFTAFWAVPMTTVPVKQIGLTTGIINTAGQIAAFISPVLVGYLISSSGGNYDLPFMVLIACLLISCAAVISMKRLRSCNMEAKVATH